MRSVTQAPSQKITHHHGGDLTKILLESYQVKEQFPKACIRFFLIQRAPFFRKAALMTNLIFRSLLWLIEFTIVVGLAGGLVDLTRTMGKEAIKAHKTGIVSLHELNQKLVGK